MAHYNYAGISPLPFTAGGTIEAYRVVRMNSTTVDSVIASTAIADPSIGCSTAVAATGDNVAIQFGGIAMLTASAAIAANAEVMVTASGAGKISTAAGATARAIGIALQAALADGDVIPVLLNLPAITGPATT